MAEGRLEDSDVTNDVTDYGTKDGGVDATADWDGYGGAGSVSVGGYDVLRLDPVKDFAGVAGLPQAVSGAAKLAQGDSDWGELFNIAGSVGDLGINIAMYAVDPLNALISAGLGFLIDVVQPLEDLLGLVTGNPERMEGEIGKWERVGNALEPLAKEILEATQQGLVGWQGAAADAARARMEEFAGGVAGIQGDVQQLVFILNTAKLLMDVAQAFVIGLIATFIEWLMFTWVPAMAAAVPTAGASTAAAAAATTAQGAIVTTRGVTFVQKVAQILLRLRRVLYRMHPRIMRRVQTSFRMRGTNGRFVRGWIGSGRALRESATDYRTWLGPADKLLNTGANEAKRAVEASGESMSDEELDRRLDPDR
ncbi:hypothetical protein SAMN05421812_13312 [Asanoa hainanensis]|uniref:PPE family protein n=1 Tax=Asanoa hainanensis TaxID=560556 RepID=A0A239PH72_9ACTN|nr:hypothetical protein [Asanoa hainanensis]SNT66135.1 hypothetical protein SAMN05421812_13312 [Asanoa hainanensis]